VGAASRAAIGGIITQVGRWTVHTFRSSGTLTVRRKVDVEYLVVAGGGGGTYSGGGSGAGGLRTNVGGTKLAVVAGSHTIVIGGGGAGNAISGNSNITWTAFGTRLGPIT
jgi:hypothetical protein